MSSRTRSSTTSSGTTARAQRATCTAASTRSRHLNGADDLETTEFLVARIDDFGTPDAYNHYAVGWAHAMDTPYQWTKQVASHWGGTRNGAVVHWPKGIEARGEVRHQFHHVIDVAPTVLDAAGLPEPKHGARRGAAPDGGREHALRVRRRGCRGPPRDAVLRDVLQPRHLRPRVDRGDAPLDFPGSWSRLPPFADDTWELYDTNTDWSQAHDLAAEMPEKLEELKALFMEEARKYNVLPLDDRRVERFLPEIAGRPTLVTGPSQLLFGGMSRLSENVTLNVKNKSHSITAQVTVPEGGAEGVIVSQGGAYAGWSLYLEGRPSRRTATTSSASGSSIRAATRLSRPASTRCGWSSATTVAASGRAAR